MFKKLASVVLVVSVMGLSIIGAMAGTSTDPNKEALKLLADEGKAYVTTIKAEIAAQKEILSSIRRQIVKGGNTTPEQKASNLVLKEKIKKMQDVNKTINETRKGLLENAKALQLAKKDLLNQYKIAKKAKDTAKMATVMEQIIGKVREINANLAQRAEIRKQMTANMNSLK